MGGGFEYGEFRQLLENMKAMEKDSRKFIEGFLYQMALRALAETRRRTPVDTGDLRGAWSLSGIAWRGDTVMINLRNPKLYASWVEFGHFQRPGRFVPGRWEGDRFVYDKEAETGMVLSEPWVDGKFMLTISIAEIERQMPKRLEAAWKRYAEGKLKGK